MTLIVYPYNSIYRPGGKNEVNKREGLKPSINFRVFNRLKDQRKIKYEIIIIYWIISREFTEISRVSDEVQG